MTFGVVGKPGSGKTYYSVYYINKYKERYVDIIHNINGLDSYTSLKNDEFYNLFIELHNFYKSVMDEVNKDELLIEKMKMIDFHPKTLVILDEAQNHLNQYKNKDFFYAFEWFMEYIRHMDIDCILLLQNVNKLSKTGLSSMIEYYIRCTPSTRQMPHVLSYEYYDQPPVEDLIHTMKSYESLKLIKDKNVFAQYGSGGENFVPVKIYSRFIPYGIFFALIIAYNVYNVKDKIFSKVDNKKQEVIVKDNNTSKKSYKDIIKKTKNDSLSIPNFIDVASKDKEVVKDVIKEDVKLQHDVALCYGRECEFLRNKFKFKKELLDMYILDNEYKLVDRKYYFSFKNDEEFYSNFRYNKSNYNFDFKK
jgi:hypothetical protein